VAVQVNVVDIFYYVVVDKCLGLSLLLYEFFGKGAGLEAEFFGLFADFFEVVF
jgi:hypothetical protein